MPFPTHCTAILAGLALLTALPGCTWVKLTDQGGTVTLVDNVASNCEKLGTTTSIGKADVASIDRNEEKVATELATLARNHAAAMGGNTIVAQGSVTDQGQQTFAVYTCD
jgi:hypothetical protein